jgi:hypothetical protein
MRVPTPVGASTRRSAANPIGNVRRLYVPYHRGTLGRGPWQYFLFDPWLKLLPGDLKVVSALQIQPILRRCAEIPGQTHRGVHGDSPPAVDDGAYPVHRNPERACQFVEADMDFLEFVIEKFARMDRW